MGGGGSSISGTGLPSSGATSNTPAASASRESNSDSDSEDDDIPETDELSELGDILNDGQSSCKELYDCSCDELDELTSIALAKGALGSRLTGAGWGGCCVSLVPDAD